MIAPDLTEEILQFHQQSADKTNGIISFWSGTMPTKEQIVETAPTLSTRILMQTLYAALVSLGNTEVFRITSAKPTINVIDRTIEYDLNRSSPTVSLPTGVPTFALMFITNSSYSFFDNEKVQMVFMGTVGTFGSGADFELTGFESTSQNWLRTSKLQYTIS